MIFRIKPNEVTRLIVVDTNRWDRLDQLQAACLMIKHDIGRLPVAENGCVIGIVTRSDTMRYFYNLLPE